MRIVINRQLAWELADQLRRCLTAKERTAVFADLGGGDESAAIHRLIHIAAERNHPLPARMVEELGDWAYAHGAEDHYAPVLSRIQDPLGLHR
ncbi:hypothetical protein [Rhodococcus jostii]|uniref:Uncharacterized protein n=1 Tax=Rhodococcus jostii TaxID=132919 RepID=A0ABU4CTF5_RHOJO|nr:hypothetical protein [Rhodococcus jostii]MDV6286758.1 hypothetical protein [Rhodococcus jostii]